MKTMKTRLTALFTAAALALSFAGCGAAASASASVAVDNGQQADYTVGILQYTSHSSLDEIAAAIQSELEQQAQAAGVTVNVELKNGQGDAATINDICKMFVSDQVDLIIPIATRRPLRRPRRCRAPTFRWCTARSPIRWRPSWPRAWRSRAKT